MSDLADRLKAKLRKPQPIAATPAPKPPAPPPSPDEVKAACGHVERLEFAADAPESKRAAKRKQAAGRVCKACREEKQKAEMEAAAARRRQAKARPPRTGWKERAARNLGRLPDGSTFSVTYDAGRQVWAGTLTVPTADGPRVFAGEAGGLFRLNSDLDRQYRAAFGLLDD